MEMYYKYININDNIKNIIISEIFRYLYLNTIKLNINILCYQLNTAEINFANYILQELNSDLILVKKLYDSDLSIYFYKKNKKSFIINMKTSSNTVTGIYINQ